MALVVAVVLSIPTAPHSATRPWPEDPDYIAEEPQPKAERRSALRAQGCSTPSAGDTGVASGPRAKVSDAELQRRYGGGKWHIYRLPADSGAVCLDGSPGAFYVHLAPNSSGWLIFFEGGGWCHHQGPCGNRRPGAKLSGLGTSKDMTATAALPQAKGILNRQTSPFRHYNMVFWKYCDASSYTGHNTIPVSIGGYAFRFQGSRILQTGIEHLRCVFGLDRASDVLLVGHSAGGMGVMLNLHHWRQAIPQSIPVYAVMDGGFFLDIQSYEEGREESRRYAAGLRYWNATAVLDPKCMRHYEPLGAPWKCLLPHYYLPFVPPEVPLFVSQSKYDIHALKVVIGWVKGGRLQREMGFQMIRGHILRGRERPAGGRCAVG